MATTVLHDAECETRLAEARGMGYVACHCPRRAAIEQARREEREALTKPLTDDELLALMRQHLHPTDCDRLIRAVWKDGIDIDHPRPRIRQFADAIRARGEKK